MKELKDVLLGYQVPGESILLSLNLHNALVRMVLTYPFFRPATFNHRLHLIVCQVFKSVMRTVKSEISIPVRSRPNRGTIMKSHSLDSHLTTLKCCLFFYRMIACVSRGTIILAPVTTSLSCLCQLKTLIEFHISKALELHEYE